MIYYPDFMGYTVKVVYDKTKVLTGTLISYDHGGDDEPPRDYDSIGIKPTETQGYYISIPIPDIVEFEVID